ncbi:OmpH family outer membrane protein [Candidatus Dependentiae bacterium]
MKRVTMLALTMVSAAAYAGPTVNMVFIDSGELLRKSKMGAAFEREVNSLRENAQKKAQLEQEKIANLEKSFSEKYKNIERPNQKEVSSKVAEIEKAKRKANFVIDEEKRTLASKIEEKERDVGQNIMDEVKAVAKDKGWGAVSDIRAAGCVFVADNVNKTTEVLKAINKKHDADVARAAIGGTKTA